MTRPLTGWGVLAWLGGFFALVFAANLAFVIMSVKTFSGEDEQKPYLQGVEFNQTLARRAEQKRLDWRATISAGRAASGAVRIDVALRRPDGAPQTGLRLGGELRHPMDENRDRPLKLKEVAAGLYRAELSGVGAGKWDVVVATGHDQVPFETSRRLWLR
jgi:nitrogen fixation protein FixH